MAKPEELNDMFLLLAENSFITGSCMTIDGGMATYAVSPNDLKI